MRPFFLVAPLVALSTGALGGVLADASDSPPAQMTVALRSLALVLGRRQGPQGNDHGYS